MLCIELPLEGVLSQTVEQSNMGALLPSVPFWKRTLVEHDDFLCINVPMLLLPPTAAKSSAVNASKSLKAHITSQIDQMLQGASLFQHTYIIVPLFLNHAADKVRFIIDKAFASIMELAAFNSKRLLLFLVVLHLVAESENLQGELWVALESIVMSAVGRKMMLQLETLFAPKTKALGLKCFALTSTGLKGISRNSSFSRIPNVSLEIGVEATDSRSKFTLASLGLRSELCSVDVSSAIEIILKLDDSKLADDQMSPMCKFSILRVFLFAFIPITQEVNEYFLLNVEKISATKQITLATDDILPLWVFSLVHATALSYSRSGGASSFPLYSNIAYLTNFHIPPPKAPHLTSELQYFVANLEAALAVFCFFLIMRM